MQFLAAVALAVALALAVTFARWLTLFMVGLFLDHPIVTLTAEPQEPAESGVAGDPEPEFEFPSRDGVTLRGRFILSPRPSRRVVIFFHEFGADGSAWRKYLGFLPAEGWHLFTFDFRGSGGSQALDGHRAHKWVTAGEVWDADAALAVVRARALREDWEVAGFGASRGGAAMLMASAAHPWLRVMACEGVSSTLESVYWHMRRWARIYVPAWLLACIPGPGWRALSHLVVLAAESREGLRFPALAEPLQALHDRSALFIYGTKDSLINEGHRQAVMAAFAGRKEAWLMPRVGHLAGPLQCRDDYRRRVLDWLEERLVTGNRVR